MKKYTRALGAYEKVFWVLDQNSSLHFAIAAEIDGQAPIKSWRFALDSVQKRHPNLSMCINGDCYENLNMEQQSDCKIPLRIVDLKHGEDWDKELETEMTNSFDMNKAPLVRAVLIQQPGKSIFIFVSNHSLGDGMSISFLIRDILSVVCGKTLGKPVYVKSIDEVLGIKAKEFMEEVKRKEFTTSKPVIRDHVSVERLKFSEDFTLELIMNSRLEKTTVHGTLAASIILAGKKLSQKWEQEPIRILHPVSLRKALNLGEDYGLLINSIIESYDPSKNVNFWDLARIVKQGLTVSKSKEWNTAVVSSIDDVFNAGMQFEQLENTLTGLFEHHLLLTNLGNIEFETDFGKLQLKALYGPLVLAPFEGAQSIGVSTVNGEMTLTLASHNPLQGLLQEAQKYLFAVCYKDKYAQAD